MMFNASITLNSTESDFYYNLLKEEDFDFRNKNIDLTILNDSKNNNLKININTDSLIDLKIANSAVIKSFEIIQKTINI